MFVFKVLLRIDFCLIALWSEKKLDMISGFLKKNYHSLLCDPACDLSWRIFCVHVRGMCILLLSGGMLYKYHLIPSTLMCHLMHWRIFAEANACGWQFVT